MNLHYAPLFEAAQDLNSCYWHTPPESPDFPRGLTKMVVLNSQGPDACNDLYGWLAIRHDPASNMVTVSASVLLSGPNDPGAIFDVLPAEHPLFPSILGVMTAVEQHLANTETSDFQERRRTDLAENSARLVSRMGPDRIRLSR